ncbi:alfa-L-arabinofuranosidase precursor [Rickenella mellea]|uniref:non-reducing end alpha-L-arabinofuranosidase n=1 Tax=Rickenella mellea TaxID=50990 RepID=A0A4Y7PYM7_9AGAM|nr:alfa-L-arabinofuranosidase precursor [Rickenella mellea]
MFHLVVLIVSLFLTKVFAQSFTITVNGTSSHPIPKTLYGWMWESGDGGLYAELLQNRAFQQVTPNTAAALNAWSTVNGASIVVVNNTASLSSALPNSLKVAIPATATGPIGVSNSGFFGINVNASWTYNGSFYYKVPSGSNVKGAFTASLKSSTGAVLASTTVGINPAATDWAQVAFKLTPRTNPADTNNVFSVTVDGADNAGQTFYFAFFSLFPPTYKNRPNGMRIDLAEVLAETQPGFFRYPGGNNLGETIAGRWNWRNTVGPLIDRPGRLGDWSYINTDGIGLKEYLDFLEDVGMPSIMAIWAGYALNKESAPEDQLAQYIQEAADQINFVIGDPAKSSAAALRASLGHPAPYPLTCVEVGNEDFFAADTYSAYRWHDFVGNLSIQFPQIQFMATTHVNSPRLTPKPAMYDLHVYDSPTWFVQNAFYYDGFARDGTKYFEGEYAAYKSLNGTRVTWPTVAGSVAEAAFLTGLERNADIVFAASYAPLLQNIASYQWHPDLIAFDTKSVFRSTSFYVQKMFSLNKGDVYLPSTLPSKAGSVFWSVTRRLATNELLIKIANANTTTATLTFNLPYKTISSTGTATILTGGQDVSNLPTSSNTVVPTTATFKPAKTFTYTAGAWSVHVLSFVAS